MRLALTCFVASFGGAFSGVVAARAIGAWVVRRTFEKMRAAAIGAGASTSRAGVPQVIGTDAPPESDCG
jgi:hypothetical protein